MLKYYDSMPSRNIPSKASFLGFCLRVTGSSLILTLAVVISLGLYENGIEKDVFTNNYTTSVLYSDSLTTMSGAAPWALLSLNWLVCRSAIKRWLQLIRKHFG